MFECDGSSTLSSEYAEESVQKNRKILSARANAFIFPRLSPLPAHTAESDVYEEDNEGSKLNKRSESQKGELHMNFTILS